MRIDSRLLIKSLSNLLNFSYKGIEFGDFETGSDEDWEPHFEAVRQKLNKELRNG